MNYDTLIIGGGLAGLQCAYKLRNKKIALLEIKGRLGGRIKTIYLDKPKVNYEAGAARISGKHKNVLNLCKQLNLTKDLKEIPKEIDSFSKINLLLKCPETCLVPKVNHNLIEKVISKTKNKPKKYLMSNNFIGIASEYLDISSIEQLQDGLGYTQNLTKMNFYDFIHYYQYSLSITNTFYKLSNGLSQIINKMARKIGKKSIHLNTRCIDIIYDKHNKLFEVKTNKNTFYSHKVICAIPKEALLKIPYFNNIHEILNSVTTNNYLRVYAIYPKDPKTKKVWFHDVPSLTTKTILREFIPIDKKKGLIEITYSDGIYAKIWENSMIGGNFHKLLKKILKKQFPKKKIPNPTYIEPHYWTNGTHYWKPNIDSSKLIPQIQQPFQNHCYICGEAYSKNQAWMEGALESANNVLELIKKNNVNKNIKKKLKIYSMNTVKKHNKVNDAWVVYDNEVFDITNWIPNHPGGKVIEKGMGKDITEMFDSVGHSQNAKIIMQKYLIGRLSPK